MLQVIGRYMIPLKKLNKYPCDDLFPFLIFFPYRSIGRYNILILMYIISFIGYPIVLPRESESVLLGAAILGSVAAKKYSSLSEAMKALNAAGQVYISSHLLWYSGTWSVHSHLREFLTLFRWSIKVKHKMWQLDTSIDQLYILWCFYRNDLMSWMLLCHSSMRNWQ